MPSSGSKQRGYVGAYCAPPEAEAFRLAAALEARTVSEALRIAMRRYVEHVTHTHDEPGIVARARHQPPEKEAIEGVPT